MGDLLQTVAHCGAGCPCLCAVLGAKRLPEMGKGLGEGLKGFKEGLEEGDFPIRLLRHPAPPAQQQNTPPSACPVSNAPI